MQYSTETRIELLMDTEYVQMCLSDRENDGEQIVCRCCVAFAPQLSVWIAGKGIWAVCVHSLMGSKAKYLT